MFCLHPRFRTVRTAGVALALLVGASGCSSPADPMVPPFGAPHRGVTIVDWTASGYLRQTCVDALDVVRVPVGGIGPEE